MRLTHIRLGSFRSFHDTELNVDAPRVLVVGLNGTGKTTLREAIRWTLQGVAQGTDAKGAGADVLIPFGGKEASVGLVVAGLGAVTRTYGEKAGGNLTVEKFSGSKEAQQTALYDRLGVTPAYLDALLNTHTFLNLKHADAKELVLAILAIRILIPGDDHEYTLAELDAMYDKAFDERKHQKKVLQTMVVPTEPVAPAHGIYQVADIEAQLAKLRGELETHLKAFSAETQHRHDLRKQVETKSNRCAFVHSSYIAGVDVDALSTDIAALEKELNALASAGSVIAEMPPDDSPDRVRFLKDRQAAIEAHKPSEGCVLDPDIRCDTSKQQFTKRAKKMLEEISALPIAGETEVTGGQSRVTLVSNRIAELRAKVQVYRQSEDEVAGLKAEIQQLHTEIAKLPDTPVQDEVGDKLRERIKTGEELLKVNTAYHAAQKQFTEARAARQKQEQEIATLEETVQALGPNGVRVQALQSQMARFGDAVNRFTTQFGLAVDFKLDPWDVMVNGRPVDTYSKSEQYRIGIAIQLAIASLSGLGFAVVDELDMLDQAGRDMVGRLIHMAPVEQVIVLQTREEFHIIPGDVERNIPPQKVKANLPRIPGWLVYRLGKSGQWSQVTESASA